MRVTVHATPDPDAPCYDPDRIAGWYDNDAAQICVSEGSTWDGENHISACSRLHTSRETLTLTASGRWVLEHDARSEFNGPHWRTYLSPEDAKQWLLRSDGNAEVLDTYFPDMPAEATTGRPAIGQPVNIRLGDLQPHVDRWAATRNLPRADTIRQLITIALEHQPTEGPA